MKMSNQTHLVFKGQGLSHVSRESIDDYTVSLGYLHDLLLYLSNGCLLGKREISRLYLMVYH